VWRRRHHRRWQQLGRELFELLFFGKDLVVEQLLGVDVVEQQLGRELVGRELLGRCGLRWRRHEGERRDVYDSFDVEHGVRERDLQRAERRRWRRHDARNVLYDRVHDEEHDGPGLRRQRQVHG
jgi:hypothetical protein